MKTWKKWIKNKLINELMKFQKKIQAIKKKRENPGLSELGSIVIIKEVYQNVIWEMSGWGIMEVKN